MSQSQHTGQLPPIRPHPPLANYYSGAETRRGFVNNIFNRTAPDYERVERLMALGTGAWYRRRMLSRSGLLPGMLVLDVAMGTGLVSRAAVQLSGDPSNVIGLDPSIGMVTEARRRISITTVLGRGEQLPIRSDYFDFLSMGYALRHLADLPVAFREYLRVLKPGGRICLLEISRPRSRIALMLLRAYMKTVVPLLTRLITRGGDTTLLMQYYWDTIETCVEPEAILAALSQAGFAEVQRKVDLGAFSAYLARKPE